jgi:hypothetical protein
MIMLAFGILVLGFGIENYSVLNNRIIADINIANYNYIYNYNQTFQTWSNSKFKIMNKNNEELSFVKNTTVLKFIFNNIG